MPDRSASPEHGLHLELAEPALVEQLALGGRLVLPLGRGWQEITVVEKQHDGSLRRWSEEAVMFVPMTGEAQKN